MHRRCGVQRRCWRRRPLADLAARYAVPALARKAVELVRSGGRRERVIRTTMVSSGLWCVSGPVCGRSVALGAVLTVAALLIAAAAASLGTARMARADQHDVEITAALVNAGQGRDDRSYEWVLLTNLGAAGVELNGWALADNSSSDALGDRMLGAGETLLVVAACSALIEAPASDWDDVLADAAIGGGLANRGDLLELRDAAGELIDAVSWGDVETHGVRAVGGGGCPAAVWRG